MTAIESHCWQLCVQY